MVLFDLRVEMLDVALKGKLWKRSRLYSARTLQGNTQLRKPELVEWLPCGGPEDLKRGAAENPDDGLRNGAERVSGTQYYLVRYDSSPQGDTCFWTWE